MQYFEELIRHVPLETFVFVGTFIEELLSPIPSFLVMVPAGAAAQAQGESVWYLLLLAAAATAGRMLAGSILYFVADKLEDVIFAKGRKVFGISHKSIEGLGKKLSSKHPKNTWLGLFALSAIPFLPTATLSLTCGFVKVKFGTYFTSNFLGSVINGLFFLYIGYIGLEGAKLVSRLDLAGQVMAILAILAVLLWLILVGIKRKKRR